MQRGRRVRCVCVCVCVHGYQEWSNVVCVGIKSRDCCVATSVPVSDNYPRFRTPLLYSRVTESVDIFPGLSTRVIIIFHPSIALQFFPIPLEFGRPRDRENRSRNTFREHLARCLRRSNYRRTTDKYLLT